MLFLYIKQSHLHSKYTPPNNSHTLIKNGKYGSFSVKNAIDWVLRGVHPKSYKSGCMSKEKNLDMIKSASEEYDLYDDVFIFSQAQND